MFSALHYNRVLSSPASCLSITATSLDDLHRPHETYTHEPIRQEHETWHNELQEYNLAGTPSPTVLPEIDLDQLLDYPPLPLFPATPFVISGTPLPNLDIIFDLSEIISCLSPWEIPETNCPSVQLHQKPHAQVSHGHNVHVDGSREGILGVGLHAPGSSVSINQNWSNGRSSVLEEEFTPSPASSLFPDLDQLDEEEYSSSHKKKVKGVRTSGHMKRPSNLKPLELRRRKLASDRKPTASSDCLTDGNKEADANYNKSRQPIKGQSGSKNLVSERNRRIKLNESLYTMRALVPRISKMDKASIVADAIDYVKDLHKQLKGTQDDILALQAGTYVPSHRQASKGVLAQPRKEVSILQHKIIEMDVSNLEPTTYQLRIHCKREQVVLLQLIKALEALKLKIVSANLVTVLDLVINTIIIKVDEASKIEDFKEMLEQSFPTYGLHF